jgi:hypothetical protein
MKFLRFFSFLLTGYLTVAGNAMLAQTESKIEIEKRVKAAQVPPVATDWLKATFDSPEKVKWYLESGNAGSSYEAKFKRNKRKFSVEFTKEGIMEDVEIVIDLQVLPHHSVEQINAWLKQNYAKYKITKLQARMTKDVEVAIPAVESNNFQFVEYYEVEFQGRSEKENELFEAIFDPTGTFISKRKIIQNSSDNLSY